MESSSLCIVACDISQVEPAGSVQAIPALAITAQVSERNKPFKFTLLEFDNSKAAQIPRQKATGAVPGEKFSTTCRHTAATISLPHKMTDGPGSNPRSEPSFVCIWKDRSCQLSPHHGHTLGVFTPTGQLAYVLDPIAGSCNKKGEDPFKFIPQP